MRFKCPDQKTGIAFAWIPTEMDDGSYLWLERYRYTLVRRFNGEWLRFRVPLEVDK